MPAPPSTRWALSTATRSRASVLALLESKIEETGADREDRRAAGCSGATPGRSSQVFQNLISNALTYRSDKPQVRARRGAHRRRGWCFSVSDNGIGIASRRCGADLRDAQRLHTQQEYGGSGMGLAICRRIVERHGGRIWAEPNAGSGNGFCFTIPDPDGGLPRWSASVLTAASPGAVRSPVLRSAFPCFSWRTTCPMPASSRSS